MMACADTKPAGCLSTSASRLASERVCRLLALVSLVVAAVLTSGCSATEQRDQSPPASLNVWELRPIVRASSKAEALVAREVAAARLPFKFDPNDIEIIDTQPRIPGEWWARHPRPPYKMIELRVPAREGIGPGDYRLWASQEDTGSAWQCALVRGGGGY